MNKGSTLVLVGHPKRQQSKLNEELAAAWNRLPNVEVRWIAGEPFDVAAEQAAVERSASVIFQYPLYWYGAPACLKQWIDDVLTWGWAFGPKGGLLQGRRCGCSITVGGNLSDYTANGKHRTTLDSLAEPFDRMCAYVDLEWMGTRGWDPRGLQQELELGTLEASLTNWLKG